MVNPCELIQRQAGELFQCAEHGEYIKIRTPYLYPDGDRIDLFVKEQNGTVTLTDLGETLRWLRMQTIAPRRSPKQQKLIEDALLTHGVELFKGMLMARINAPEDFAAVLSRLSQASIRVADLWFTFRTRAIETITDEVSDFLDGREIPYQRGERIVGRSGRIWTPDFHTRVPARSSLVFLLSTGSRTTARRVSEHVLSACVDLNNLTVGPEAVQFVSLFDDTIDVWADEDFKLVESLSQVALWSNPDEFVEIIKTAA